MIRELVLQLKQGSIRPAYFREKYGVDVLERFREQLASLDAEGYLARPTTRRVALTRDGLLRVDVLLHALLPAAARGDPLHLIASHAHIDPFRASASGCRAPSSARRRATGILHPLDFVYARAGVAPPTVERVAPAGHPEPYRSLLVHERDMTITLERISAAASRCVRCPPSRSAAAGTSGACCSRRNIRGGRSRWARSA